MKPHPLVLIIDDEQASQRLLGRLLEGHGYRVSSAFNGATGIREAGSHRQDVIILELDLPDVDGLAVLKRLREWSRIPILVLSARHSETNIVEALDAGANDYMAKPFSSTELLARLRVMLRTTPGTPHEPLLIQGNLAINVATHTVTYKNEKIRLTATEEALFYMLAQAPGSLVTCSHALNSIWGGEGEEELNCLRVYIASLRKKLQPYHDEVAIQTEGNVGYRLVMSYAHERVVCMG